jgi:hypothetical protein
VTKISASLASLLRSEQHPGNQREPGDEADCGVVDSGMKMIEDGFVMGDKFPVMAALSAA